MFVLIIVRLIKHLKQKYNGFWEKWYRYDIYKQRTSNNVEISKNCVIKVKSLVIHRTELINTKDGFVGENFKHASWGDAKCPHALRK